MRYPRLRYYDKDGCLGASDALLMCFYMPHPNERIASGVIRAVEIFRERIRPYQFVWNDTGDGQAEPLDDASWERTRRQTLESGFGGGGFLRLEGKTHKVDGLLVDYRGLSAIPLPWPDRKDDVCVLYLRLPTEYLEERGPEHVHSLALELAAELPFSSGYADFVLCSSDEDSVEALKLIRPRYPGVHLAASRATTMNVNTWVEGVHWMNFLGQPVLGKLGGVSGLRERLPLPGLSLQEMSGDRVLITLGERPEVGDMEAGQTLPLHRALARVLEPYLYRRKPPFSFCAPIPEELLRWDRRFLD
ncbi:type VI immunity family protein [Archangium sp.]|uniref:type VI immunity family protein n=1 Tax=Archangium sp. TaxID=1872627 RepID=UPI002D4E40F1|nr:type VI immunity family protein [Archangium sp.]HYO53893.1 type VI immunity family protein [Archangium sp.]